MTTNKEESAEAVAQETAATENAQIPGLTQEQITNLTGRMEKHIQVQNGKLVDTLNNIELEVTVESGKVYVTNPFGNSFSVQQSKLNNDEIKPRKKKVLAEKTTTLITHAITSQNREAKIQEDCDAIESRIKNQKLGLGKFKAVEHVEDDYFKAQFETGLAYVTKTGENQFKLNFFQKDVNQKLDEAGSKES